MLKRTHFISSQQSVPEGGGSLTLISLPFKSNWRLRIFSSSGFTPLDMSSLLFFSMACSVSDSSSVSPLFMKRLWGR